MPRRAIDLSGESASDIDADELEEQSEVESHSGGSDDPPSTVRGARVAAVKAKRSIAKGLGRQDAAGSSATSHKGKEPKSLRGSNNPASSRQDKPRKLPRQIIIPPGPNVDLLAVVRRAFQQAVDNSVGFEELDEREQVSPVNPR